ncbi:MAG: universal stress protein [Bacteroidales bacterium]|nr:MAG: universal stress protein [Bacteroidales bacterium]
MSTKKNILLVPVDFGDQYHLALTYAKQLAPIINGEIHLLHVLDLRDWWLEDIKPEKLTNDAFNKLIEVSRKFQLDQKTVYKVLQGKRHEKIVEYADENLVRYILMVDNIPGNPGEIRLGSTLSNVIIMAKQPVITVKKVTETKFKNILVPLDLANDCRLKLFNSISLALQHNAKINIVSVVFGDIEQEESRVQEKINKYARLYQENHIDYSVKILRKDEDFAYRAILDYSTEINCDSIIIMTHRESGIDNYLGAFAHHIINESPIPVITLNNASSNKAKRNLISSILDPIGIFS